MTTAVRQKAYRYGLWAETLCVCMLTLKGYVILGRRVRTPYGEIDLIARRGRTIVFIEVKARRTLDEGLYALGYTQQQRILTAAQSWVGRHPRYAQHDLRCDLMVVAGRWRLRHLRNAFGG